MQARNKRNSYTKNTIVFTALISATSAAASLFFTNLYTEIILVMVFIILAAIIIENILQRRELDYRSVILKANIDDSTHRMLSELNTFVQRQAPFRETAHDVRYDEIIDEVAKIFARMNRDGTISISDPELERRKTAELISGATSQLLAVSIFAKEYWQGNDGAAYLGKQKVMADKGIRIRRIFVYPKTDSAWYHDHMQNQASMGVECYFQEVDEPRMYEYSDEDDYVIIDNRILNHATKIIRGSGYRKADVVFDQARVAGKVSDWQALLEVCQKGPQPNSDSPD